MIIDLRDHWAEIEAIARERQGFKRGEQLANKALAPRGGTALDSEIDGVAGEFAVAIALHQSTDRVTVTRIAGDGGVDGAVGKLTYDVKTTRLPTGRLLLPTNVQSRASLLILAVGVNGDRSYPPCLRLAGWIPRSFFDRIATVDRALPRPAPALEQRHLFDMSVLIKMMEGFR